MANDNLFSVGQLLARHWGKRREDREFERELKAAEAARNAANAADIDAAHKSIIEKNKAQYLQTARESGKLGTADNPNFQFFADPASKLTSQDNGTIGLTADWLKKGLIQNGGSPREYVFKGNTNIPDVGQALQNYVRPDEGEVKSLSDMAARHRRANEDYNAEGELASLRRQWAERGVTPENMARLTDVLMPQMQERQRQHYEEKTNFLTDKFTSHINKGEINAANMTLAQLQKYNPQMAASLASTNISPLLTYKTGAEMQLNDRKFDQTMMRDQQQFKYETALRDRLIAGQRALQGDRLQYESQYGGYGDKKLQQPVSALDKQMEVVMQSMDNVEESGKEIDKFKQLMAQYGPILPQELKDKYAANMYFMLATREMEHGNYEQALIYARALSRDQLVASEFKIDELEQEVAKLEKAKRKDRTRTGGTTASGEPIAKGDPSGVIGGNSGLQRMMGYQ